MSNSPQNMNSAAATGADMPVNSVPASDPPKSSCSNRSVPVDGITMSYVSESQETRLVHPATDAELLTIMGPARLRQPGQLGNLTPFQENKLREMWIISSSVFGVIDPAVVEQLNQILPDAATAPVILSGSKASSEKQTAGSPGNQKSGGSFWRRKKDAESTSSPSPTPSAQSDSTGEQITNPLAMLNLEDYQIRDDKFGSNKIFREVMASPERRKQLREIFWTTIKCDHPDALMLRFLAARKWDVRAAFVMAVAALHWRVNIAQVDSTLLLSGEEGCFKGLNISDAAERQKNEGVVKLLRMGVCYMTGRDKLGRPMSYIRPRLHRLGAVPPESLERYTVLFIEAVRLSIVPPFQNSVIVIDLNGFGVYNIDYVPVKFIIQCFESNYPESLGFILMHRAPWVFSAFWNVIKGWLDPVVASKIHFTKSLDDVLEHIDLDQLPKEMGGNPESVWEYIEPVEGENDRMLDTETRDKLIQQRNDIASRFEESTMEWVIKSILTARGDEPAMNAEVVEEASRRRHTIALQMRQNFWKLDPYLRARSVYDRNGFIPQSYEEAVSRLLK